MPQRLITTIETTIIELAHIIQATRAELCPVLRTQPTPPETTPPPQQPTPQPHPPT